MSGKLKLNPQKIRQFPSGEPFVMLPRELVCSTAWRKRSINCIRLIDFLLREHMNHGGSENGNLLAPYDQLVKWGLSRRLINSAIDQAEQLGLIWVDRGGFMGPALSRTNIFTLTFLPAKYCVSGKYYYQGPTNDWKRVEEEK